MGVFAEGQTRTHDRNPNATLEERVSGSTALSLGLRQRQIEFRQSSQEREVESLHFIQDRSFNARVVHGSPKFVGESREATVFVKGFDLFL